MSPVRFSIFVWDTLKEIGSHDLKYESGTMSGKIVEVELTSGEKVHAWRAVNGQDYFCHGLTFGGKEAPGGAVSPFSGKDVQIILDNHYRFVDPESDAVPGDILVWKGLGGDTPHSAILTDPVVLPGKKYLDYASKVRTKNGRYTETEMTLERLTGDEFFYGDSFNVYRRR